MAGRPGFEPGLTGSEPVVLPLNYLPSGFAVAAFKSLVEKMQGDFLLFVFLCTLLPRLLLLSPAIRLPLY